MFVDPCFPPNDASLWGVQGVRRCFEKLEWLRPEQISSSQQLFEGSLAEPKPRGMCNVTQGMLSDCYLVAAIALCARHPCLLSQLFVAYKPEEGWCTVKLFLNGHWEEITLDTLVPCYEKSSGEKHFAFAHHFEGELYACFLEKACAKAYGSYASLIGGHVDEALMDLTALPVEEINLLPRNPSDVPFDAAQIVQHWEKGDLLACSWVSKAGLPRHGVKQNHTYLIVDVTEETGLSPSRIKFEMLDPASQCPGSHGEQGHTFWVESQDFPSFFNRLSICHAGMFRNTGEVQRIFTSVQVTDANAGGCSNFASFHNNTMFRVFAKHPVPLFVTLSQPDARRISNDFGGQTMYPQIGVTVLLQGQVKKDVETDSTCCTRNRRQILVQTPFSSKRDVSVIFSTNRIGEEMEYRVVPSFFFPGDLGMGRLQVHFISPGEVSVEELNPSIKTDVSFLGTFNRLAWNSLAPGPQNSLPFDPQTSFKIKAASLPVPITLLLTQEPEESLWHDSLYASLHLLFRAFADQDYISLPELDSFLRTNLSQCVDADKRRVVLARCHSWQRIGFGHFLSILFQAGLKSDLQRISHCTYCTKSEGKKNKAFIGVAPLSNPIPVDTSACESVGLPARASLAAGCDQVPHMSDVSVWSASFLIQQSEFYLCPLIRAVDQGSLSFRLQIRSPLAGLVVERCEAE